MYTTKQVIIIRRDLKMRRGKEIAQGSHASMAFMSHLLREMQQAMMKGLILEIPQAVKDWINGSFAKVVLQVEDEQALLEVHKAAQEAGLTSHLITDSGFTEFHGVPTNTAVAIGPDYSDKIDALTGPEGRFPLKLY